MSLVRHLGTKELLVQDSSGLLLHGPLGEKFVNHYTFYAAFASGRGFDWSLGPDSWHAAGFSDAVYRAADSFAGKTWIVEIVDESQKVIFVKRASGGAASIVFRRLWAGSHEGEAADAGAAGVD